MTTPKTPEQFVGKTGLIAKVLFAKAERFKTDKTMPAMDRRYLFTGEAGTGKTSLAMALASFITGNTIESILNRSSFNVDWINGQSWTVDKVREWTVNGHYLPMYGDRIVKIIDEIDCVSTAAANESLSYLDALPPHTMLFATTNKQVKDLPDRFQSRFKVHRFDLVPAIEIESWLFNRFPRIGPDWVRQIASSCGGNVRAAETDALSRLDCMEVMA